MLRFNEKELFYQIEQLGKQHRAAFAAACAERLLPSYLRFSKRTGWGDYFFLVNTLEDLWKNLSSEQKPGVDNKDIDVRISTTMSLIPAESDGQWVSEQACAEDAASAVVYALRCFRTGEAQEAVWAARRSYECLDHYVINSEKIDINVSEAEGKILSHPLIQAELARQQRDVSELLRKSITLAELRQRAHSEAVNFLPTDVK